ncbi:hypothetical protein LCGC14_0732130 [marine sediment metagenome]|uniref:Uncharacterized protein n=1 Tax=marine sediment metagenome TaxID=412755 RepID=A0A0F9QU99_9ZZZZ
MELKCYKCDHIWDYKGKSNHYVCCPECYNKISLRKIAKQNYILPTKELHTTENLERVYFPDGFDCLVHKDIAPQFKELTLEDLNENKETVGVLEKEHTPYKKIIESPQTEFIEIEEGINLCDVHNLPASYDDLDKIWTCKKCREFETPNAKPIIYPSAQINKIQKEESIKIIPRDPIKLFEHQRSFF